MSVPASPGPLLLEAWRSALARRVLSAVVALVVAAVVGGVMLTTGQSAAAEQRVLARIDSAASRTIEVTVQASEQPALPARVVPVLAALSGTESVVGLGTAVDTRNAALGAGGEPIAVWAFHGEVSLLDPSTTRAGDGQVLVGERALDRWREPTGLGTALLPGAGPAAAVGVIAPTGPLAFLGDGAVRVSDDPDEPLQQLLLTARDAADVPDLVAAVVGLTDVPEALRVVPPTTLADLQAAVAGDLGAYGRDVLVGALGGGFVLVALGVVAQVMLGRRDLGRRRALGARRSTVVTLVVVQNLLAGGVGTAVGVLVAAVVSVATGIAAPPAGFVAGLCVLALLLTAAASVPAAVGAARRDPVAVLRTP